MKCILSQYQGGSLSEAADLDVALWDVYACILQTWLNIEIYVHLFAHPICVVRKSTQKEHET